MGGSPSVVVVACALVLSPLAACESVGRRETASLAAAVERFQRAPNDGRPAAAPGVAAVACTDPAVAQACVVCIEATKVTARALSAKARVEEALEALRRGTLTPEEAKSRHLDEELAAAMKDLQAGQAKMPLCEERLAALKREHGL